MSSGTVQPRKVLVAGVPGRPWRSVIERVSSYGHSVSQQAELPPLGSGAFRPEDYDLIAFGLPHPRDSYIPYIREVCGGGAKPKLLLLGEPPAELALPQLDPWGRLAYIATSRRTDVLTEQLLECLDNDWLVWGSPGATADVRAGLEELPRHLRPLLSMGGVLLRQVSSLSCDDEFEGAMQHILSSALEMVGGEGASFLAWDPAAQVLTLRGSVGSRAARTQETPQKLGEGVAGWVVERSCPLLVWDLDLVARFAHRPKRQGGGRSFVCVPVAEKGRLFGALTANARMGQVFTSAVLKAFSVLAEDLACALAIASELPASVPGARRAGAGRRPALATGAGEPAASAKPSGWPSAFPWEQFLSSLPMGIVALDRDAQVTFSNELAASLLGLGGEVPQGSALGERLGLGERRWSNVLRHVLADGQVQEFFQVPAVRSPAQKWLHLFLVPERGPAGEVVGVLVVILEVKESAALEQRMAHMERQALLGEFAAKVAHELNNTLDGIMRFVSLALRRRADAERSQEYLEDARAGLARMANVVARLLAFSRGWVAVSQEANVGEMIQEALRSFAERAKEQGVTFAVDVADPIPEVRSSELFEVFANLIKNALEAMPAGGRLTVRSGRNDHEATVTFADTGVGMSEEVKEKIFQPFFTTKTAGGGTGLGLAISQDIARRYGGSIEVESEPGTGTTFTVRFPVASGGR